MKWIALELSVVWESAEVNCNSYIHAQLLIATIYRMLRESRDNIDSLCRRPKCLSTLVKMWLHCIFSNLIQQLSLQMKLLTTA